MVMRSPRVAAAEPAAPDIEFRGRLRRSQGTKIPPNLRDRLRDGSEKGRLRPVSEDRAAAPSAV